MGFGPARLMKPGKLDSAIALVRELQTVLTAVELARRPGGARWSVRVYEWQQQCEIWERRGERSAHPRAAMLASKIA
jgi:hypothetical protein